MSKEDMSMQNGASRPGGRPLNCPHRPTPQPIIHRSRRRDCCENEPVLRGKEFWQCMGIFVIFQAVLMAVWYLGGQ